MLSSSSWSSLSSSLSPISPGTLQRTVHRGIRRCQCALWAESARLGKRPPGCLQLSGQPGKNIIMLVCLQKSQNPSWTNLEFPEVDRSESGGSDKTRHSISRCFCLPSYRHLAWSSIKSWSSRKSWPWSLSQSSCYQRIKNPKTCLLPCKPPLSKLYAESTLNAFTT